MDRRAFLAATGVAAVPLSGSLARAQAGAGGDEKQWLDLRVYHVADEGNAAAFDRFLADVLIPACGRAGVSPVGAFRLADDVEQKGNPLDLSPHDRVVLLAHASAESAAGLADRLLADPVYVRDGSEVHTAPTRKPVYERVESWLMLAFDAAPTVARPATGDGRVFQLRIYESHNERAAAKKREMFNDAGEIAVFRECGMDPVFFGQSLAGRRLPNLIYMLAFESMEAQAAAWGRFMPHPTWQKLRKDPRFKGTVSRISNTFLRPLACSQL